MHVFRSFRLSIRAKVLLLALGLALPPLIVVSLLGLASLDTARDTAMQIGTNALRSQAEENLEKRALDKARLYDATMEGIEHQVQNLATNVTSLITAGPASSQGTVRVWISPDGPTPANMQSYAQSVARAQQISPVLSAAAEHNSLISLAYVALENGGVVAFDHDIIDVLLKEQLFDVHTRPWYILARDAGHTVWVDTYVDANTKQLVTTCATPLYDANHHFIGVVAFDLLLDTIQQDLLKLDLGAAGYAFLVNTNGNVLVRPDLRPNGLRWNEPFAAENLLNTQDAKLHAAFERMTQLQQGIEPITYQGEKVYLAYAPIQRASWSIGIVIPESAIIQPSEQVGAAIASAQQQLRTQVLMVLGVSVCAVLALGALFSALLTRPLRQLQAGAQRIAAGDLQYHMARITNDEIGDLARSFNVMAYSLSQKMLELEENLRQLSMLNTVSNHFKTILSLPQLFNAIPRAVCDNFGFERAVLYLLEGEHLRAISASFGRDADAEVAEFMSVANAQPITLDSETVEADIIRSGQAVIIDNPWQHPRVSQAKQEISRSDSYVQVPIFGHEEHVIGLLSADYKYSQRVVNARDAAQLLTYASMVGLTIENTRLYNELERQVADRTIELRVALERAQEADRLKSEFLASISHELRTPLNAIIGFSTVMLDELDGPISAMQREDLKTINQNGLVLLHLINELLDLAKIEAGKLDLSIQQFDLFALVTEVSETVGGLLHHKPIVLRALLPPTLPQVRADYGKVRQILLNLLSNAVKFTERGTISIMAQCVLIDTTYLDQAVDTHTAPPLVLEPVLRTHERQQLTPYVAISVRDTGTGIAPEHLSLLFEEFRQLPNRRGEKQGSGLGLAICAKLIAAHGGRIWVESLLGQGSTFTFTLPCVLAQPTAADIASADLPEQPQAPDSSVADTPAI